MFPNRRQTRQTYPAQPQSPYPYYHQYPSQPTPYQQPYPYQGYPAYNQRAPYPPPYPPAQSYPTQPYRGFEQQQPAPQRRSFFRDEQGNLDFSGVQNVMGTIGQLGPLFGLFK